MNVFLELNKFNYIRFDEGTHIYRTDYGTSLMSVSALLSLFKKPFNTQFWAVKKSREEGISVQQKIREWENKSNDAKYKGTAFHSYVENYIGKKITHPLIPDELIAQWEDFYSQYIATEVLIPVASELIIGSIRLGIAGMFDQLFYSKETGKYHLFDWKTNGQFRSENKWGSKYKKPLNKFEECEVNTYRLQLLTYAYILMTETNIPLGNSYAVWFNEENSSYVLFEYEMTDEMYSLIAKMIEVAHGLQTP